MKNPCDLYIITTAKKRDNLDWEKELNNYYMSTDPKVHTYSNKVIIDSWNNIKKYVNVKNSFFIFDEQRVVGYGEWTKSFLRITKLNKWILLSATPGDTWSDYMPVFIANGFYRNKTDFVEQHIIYDRNVKFPKVKSYMNTGRLLRFKKDILINMDFERETIRHNNKVEVSYNYKDYKTVNDAHWNIFENKPIENKTEYCYVLRRIVNSDPSRIKAVLDIVFDHPKCIIFYMFNYELELLREAFKNYPHAEYNGHLHQELPTGREWVYLVQYTAGCEGWNCITTDTIIFYSQNYSYKVMEQAAGRIDRMNTPYKDLYYYHIKSNAKIDLAIYAALVRKKTFNENTFAKQFKPTPYEHYEQMTLFDEVKVV